MKDAAHADHADHTDLPQNWRDARLAQALRHMPDAQTQPDVRTRHAVLQHARNAVAGTPTKRGAVDAVRRWWRGWWGHTASGARWSVALASLAVFGFMVLLWQAQVVEIPVASRHEAAETAVVADGSPAPAPESARASAAPATASVLAQSKTRARVIAPVTPPAPAMPSTQQTSPTTVANPTEMASADAAASSNAVAPIPAPALTAPAPVAAALPAAPAMADAKLQQRARADEAVPPVVRILAGKRQSRLSLEQADELLAQLRALRYGTAPGGLAASVGAVAQEGMVVEMEGQERWVIAPDYVEHHSRVAKDGDAATNRSAITPEQYAQLLRLVNALLSR